MIIEGITWIAFFVALPLSQTANLCTKDEGCDPKSTSNIRYTSPPNGNKDYVSPGPVLLNCETTREVKTVLWIRNNSVGESKILNTTEFGDLIPVPGSPKVAKLKDYAPVDKYSYECIEFGKCCDEIRSMPATVYIRPPFSVNSLSSTPEKYHGIGSIKVTCSGYGDKFTRVHWIRTNENGKNVTLNTTTLTLDDPGIWQALLENTPVNRTMTYSYYCVAENKCCAKITSSPLRIPYILFTECPFIIPINKPLRITKVPSKRSVHFSWSYDPDPEDIGFTFQVSGITEEERMNITAREFTVHGLVPNQRYDYIYTVIFTIPSGQECKTHPALNSFTTQADYPSRPQNVSVIVKETTLNITWLPPKYPNGIISHYLISWAKSDEDANSTVLDQPMSTTFVLRGLDYSTTYSIRLFVVNNVGISNSTTPVFVTTDAKPTVTSSLNNGAIAGGVTAAVLVLIIVVVILYLIRKRMEKKKRKEAVMKFESSIHQNDKTLKADILASAEKKAPQVLPRKTDLTEEISYIVLLEDWEIAPDKLQLLDKKLGGGQFGIVKQGLLTSGKGDPEVVAVKTLKDNAKESDLQDLMAEMKILKEVNKVPHPNVMKLIGGCSIEGKLHLVMEFCPGGNLRSLLIKSRVYPSEENSSNYINLASTLNHRQLLKIAADIANGMTHLSAQKLVHRDLAARNILIGEGDTAKVSDFGLARNVGGAEEYIRNNQNLLPVKWMALESLLHGRFTTASDVWSYGVLLHEVTTLGEEPYKDISPYNIVSHVGSGCRLPQPPQCADEVYEIMKNCWMVEPTDRPTFKEIRESLQSMLMDTEKSYINITHIVDEGPLIEKAEGTDVSPKDGAMRYTTAF